MAFYFYVGSNHCISDYARLDKDKEILKIIG